MNSNSTSRRFTVITKYRGVVNKGFRLTVITKVFHKEQAVIDGRFELISIRTACIC